jgi:hypothetical protein
VRFDLDINGIGSREVSGARIQLHFRKAPVRDAIEIVASADRLHLAPVLQADFGADIRSANIEASLGPATPFAALFDGRAAWDRALDAWRQSSGALRLTRLEINWAGAQMNATGDVGLDGAHRPQGSLALHVDGRVEAPVAGATGGRLARAIAGVTKTANEGPRILSVDIVSGAVNIRVTKDKQIISGAGSLGPLY